MTQPAIFIRGVGDLGGEQRAAVAGRAADHLGAIRIALARSVGDAHHRLVIAFDVDAVVVGEDAGDAAALLHALAGERHLVHQLAVGAVDLHVAVDEPVEHQHLAVAREGDVLHGVAADRHGADELAVLVAQDSAIDLIDAGELPVGPGGDGHRRFGVRLWIAPSPEFRGAAAVATADDDSTRRDFGSVSWVES